MSKPVDAQTVDLANRPVAAVRIEGIKQAGSTLVENQIRLQPGDPYNAALMQEDVVRLTHLGKFGSVTADVQPQSDGSVVVIYHVTEMAMLADVVTVGNKNLTDQELLAKAGLKAGDPVDPFLIQRGINQMKAFYESEGYFQAEISVDQEQLKESGILLFKVREGPLAKLRDIRFEGNQQFDEKQLWKQIKSRTAIWIFRKGEVNREQLEEDAAKLREFYRDHGYLDAQVGRRIEISPDQEEAIVFFMVHEGREFTVDKITIEGNDLYSTQQILEAMDLKSGDVFTSEKARRSHEAILDLYGKLGFIETKIESTNGQQGMQRIFHEGQPKVDLVVRIVEGKSYNVGRVTTTGNEGTQDKVILREVRGLEPGRRFDRAGIKTTENRLKDTPLFSNATVTVLGDVEQETRDVLINVQERQTGSVAFGAGISSDSGLLGSVEFTQKNFDITDVPESWSELFSGKAFRGAGQTLHVAVEPGDQYSQYAVSFREPSFFETSYFVDAGFRFFERERDYYDENRLGGNFGIGKRFGDVWSISARSRADLVNVDVTDENLVSKDASDVRGDHWITLAGFVLARNTTDSNLFPTQGSVLELALDRAGAFGGDYDFTRTSLSYRKFWTVDEDFFGYKTVLSFRGEAAYIFEDMDEVPLFERLYAGGRTFRGFKYRGIGPIGLLNKDTSKLSDEHVGGTWMFLTGMEYNYPIWEDLLRGVFFIDAGTVDSEISFDQYRVAVGAGIRVKIPFLGQAPFALDFAFPLMSESGDDERFFSFDLALPFR